MIRDKANDAQKPDYTVLPPVTYVLPSNPEEMGPEPKAGGRMKIDNKKNQITIYDPATQNFKTIDFTMVDFKENIDKEHPLVYDKEADKPKKFPVIDKDKKTVTIYSGRQKTLSVIQLPEEYFSMAWTPLKALLCLAATFALWRKVDPIWVVLCGVGVGLLLL